MNQFSIRDIENLCGVKAHTLRIWEQRYNLFTPKRKQESLHRIYDCDDLKELLRISFLYHHGFKISKIAAMPVAQIQEEIIKIKPKEGNYELFIHQLIEASLQLDKDAFENVVNTLVLRIGIEKCIQYVFYPFLNRIGLLWMTNHVIPAQEHFCSHIIRNKIICAIDGLEPATNEHLNMVIFAPLGEMHEIPLLVINYFIKKAGIHTTYFGTNVSTNALQYYAAQHPVTHFYMHVITHFDSCSLASTIHTLCMSFKEQLVYISGPACKEIKDEAKNLRHIHSLNEAIALAQSLIDHTPAKKTTSF